MKTIFSLLERQPGFLLDHVVYVYVEMEISVCIAHHVHMLQVRLDAIRSTLVEADDAEGSGLCETDLYKI